MRETHDLKDMMWFFLLLSNVPTWTLNWMTWPASVVLQSLKVWSSRSDWGRFINSEMFRNLLNAKTVSLFINPHETNSLLQSQSVESFSMVNRWQTRRHCDFKAFHQQPLFFVAREKRKQKLGLYILYLSEPRVTLFCFALLHNISGSFCYTVSENRRGNVKCAAETAWFIFWSMELCSAVQANKKKGWERERKRER